jgi:tetratricopeptide (TPR) repeat protein
MQSNEADQLRQAIASTLVGVAEQIPDPATRQQIAAVALAIPHVEEVATALANFLKDEDLISPFIGLGRFYKGQGLYQSAELWYNRCLEVTIARFGTEHLTVIISLNALAGLYFLQGRYGETESLYLKALELSKHPQ